MRLLSRIFAALILMAAAVPAFSKEKEEVPDVNIKEVIFGHISDSYEWHITDIGHTSLVIHLPVILHSRTSGWHVFGSGKLEGGEYEGFRIAGDGEKNEGKLVEVLPDGSVVKPLDISITKNVLAIFISSALLVLIVLLCARWYRTHDVEKDTPTGLAALMEPIIMMVHTDMVKDCIGEDYQRYSPYLCTAFLWIFLNNLLGIVPFFPGGANLTGNIAITLALALCTFIAVNFFGNKHYYKDIFWPDVPVFMKAPVPLMPVIELFSALTKPLSLTIRLFANMLSGHILMLSLCCMIFMVAKYGAVLLGSMSVLAVVFGVFADALELLVAFIQAYVFTILSAIFIGLSRQKPQEES